MTYNDIATPIRKTIYGEADVIYTFLSAHHGRIDAIAKGIRKPTSRKRGNIDYGVFSDIQFAKGKNMDTVVEAQIVSFNEDLLTQNGLKYLYEVLPLINKFSSDVHHSIDIFDFLTNNFMTYSYKTTLFFRVSVKFFLLNSQNLLPDWSTCYLCRVKFDKLDKYSIPNQNLICNNCARKVEFTEFANPANISEIENYSEINLKILENILDSKIREIFPKFNYGSLHKNE